MSDDGWLFQVSPKLDDGTLINVRGRSTNEFYENLEWVKEHSPVMMAALRAVREACTEHKAAVIPLEKAQETVQAVMPATVVDDDRYTCVHGKRVLRTNKPGESKWTAYFCPSPKGTPDQCKTIFVN